MQGPAWAARNLARRFDDDVPAACAAGLAANMDTHLSSVTPLRFNDSLIWNDSGIWHLTSLPYGHLLLIWSSPEERVGRLRIATQRAAQPLVPMLGPTT
ncbi:hypothetical protein GO283_01625 [Ralstonia solanacearum]|nr:hypothetical protein [Ralstonia solanacearum]NKA93093.1 hypothetical protein [Ralstonia solanacearum]